MYKAELMRHTNFEMFRVKKKVSQSFERLVRFSLWVSWEELFTSIFRFILSKVHVNKNSQTVEVFTIQLFNNYTNRLSKTVYQHTLKSYGLSSFYPSKWQSIFVGQIWRSAKRFKKITVFISFFTNSKRL